MNIAPPPPPSQTIIEFATPLYTDPCEIGPLVLYYIHFEILKAMQSP